MNEPAVGLLVALGRATLLLAVAAVVVRAMLAATGCTSPRAHRAAWVLVLLQGWLLLRLTVAVPYYEAPLRAPPRIAESAGETRAHRPLPAASSVPMPPVDVARTGAAHTPRSPKRNMEKVAPPGATGVSPVHGQDARGTPQARCKDHSVARGPVGPTWAASARQSWPALVVGVWLAGMGVLVVRALVRYLVFVRRLRPGQPAEDGWLRQWEKLQADEGIRRPVRLRMTPQLGPVLCRLPGGWELLLPVDLWRRLTPAGRLAVLRHELAHLKRGDAWKSLLVRFLALPHWFNPAAWWAVRKFEEAAEWACDGAAAGVDRARAVEYARTLLHLGTPLAQHAACGPAARGHGLSIRVRRLLRSGTVEDSIMKRLLVITIALGLVVACLLRFDLVAKEPPAAEAASVATETIAAATAPRSQSEPNPPAPMGGGMIGMSGAMGAEGMGYMGMETMGAPAGASAPTAPDMGMEMMGAAPEASKPHATRLPLGSLRYDGKSFDQWQNEWKTELKPERRAEAINAFAAFGANGYGEEAAEAILEVMRGLDMDLADASFSKADFQKGSYTGTRLVKMSAIAGFLGVQPDYRIPPDDAVRVLSRELETGNRNGRLFAVFALSNMEHEAEAAVPALRTAFEGDEDPTVRCCAYVALGSMAPYLGREMDAALQVSPETLAELLEEAEPEALDRLLGTLVPPPGSWPGVLFREKPSSRARPAFGYSGAGDYYGGMEEEYYGAGMGGFGASTGPSRELRPGAEPIIQTLIEALDSENAATRSQAIQALGRVGPEVEGVVPALLRAFEKGRPYDREEILRTLERFASNETRSNMMPGMAGMPGGMPGGPGGYPSESEEQRPSAVEWKKVIPPLIAALDPRRPADLAMMGRIYARFGELAHETIPILEKAAEDEDEEVRRAAKQVLEVMSRSRNRGGVSGMGGMF